MVENIIWGGSGIEKVVYDFILNNVTPGSIVIELGGGGVSTQVLGEKYELYTIEHDLAWIHKFKRTKYIWAPLKNGWYDIVPLGNLPNNIEMILVDGPSGGHIFNLREGILKHYNLFNNASKYLFHDTYREKEICIAKELAQILNKNIKFYEEGNPKDYWAFLT